MKLIVARSRRNEIIAVSGMWYLKDRLKILKLVPDGFIIYPGEIVLAIEDVKLLELVKYIDSVEKFISLSTTLARLRKELGTDKRIFICLSTILNSLDDLARAAYCGGADGILNDLKDVEISVRDNTVQIIDVEKDDRQYVTVRLDELSKLSTEDVKNVHGIIIYLHSTPSISLLRYLRERCIILYGKSRIIIALPHIYLNYSILRKAREIIYGVALSSFGTVVKLDYIDYQGDIFMYRCSDCRRDLISRVSMRKCPRCGQRLIELLKEPSDRYFKYTARELKYVFTNMLKIVEKGVVVDYYGY
ncbi:MAG: hypothetical protein GXO10_03535 [Crenarchaeota archaeon]|nr:hypothetical protein [Thermoproteota archaeon]